MTSLKMLKSDLLLVFCVGCIVALCQAALVTLLLLTIYQGESRLSVIDILLVSFAGVVAWGLSTVLICIDIIRGRRGSDTRLYQRGPDGG